MRCIGPRAKDADLCILIWEEVHRVHQEGILLEVEQGAMLDEGDMALVRATTIHQEWEEVYAASQYHPAEDDSRSHGCSF